MTKEELNSCIDCVHSICICRNSLMPIYRCMRKVKKELDPVTGKYEYLSYKLALNCHSEREIYKDFKEYIELLFGSRRDKCGTNGNYFKSKW